MNYVYTQLKPGVTFNTGKRCQKLREREKVQIINQGMRIRLASNFLSTRR